MKKWFFRVGVILFAVAAIFCFMGVDVNCDGQFQGINCGIDGCNQTCTHSFKVIEETESTCSVAGYVKYECRKCHYVKTENKSTLAHTLTTTLHRGDCGAPTSLERSWYREEVCSVCDYEKKDYYYDAAKNGALHIYDEGVITYYDDGNGCGEILYTCLICGGTKTEYYHSTASPQQRELNEKLSTAAAEHTCGRYQKTCEVCNHLVSDIWHDFSYVDCLVDSTETEYGLGKKTCYDIIWYGKCTYSDSIVYYLIPPVNYSVN